MDVNNFNLEDEIKKVKLNKTQDVNGVIKGINKFERLVRLGSIGVYNLNRAIFTPRENARQKGSLAGMHDAFSEGKRILNDSLRYDWEQEVIIKELAKSITKNYEALELAQADLDDRKPKKIYMEIYHLSKISYLIRVWDMLFYPMEQVNENYLKRTMKD